MRKELRLLRVHRSLPRGSNPALAGLLAAGFVLAAAASFVSAATRRSEEANPPQGRFIRIQGVDLHYFEVGDGPSVIILHGNGAMAEEMAISGLIEELAEDHRVVVFDRPGYGHSSRPRGTLWTPERQARLILEACEELRLRQPVIVGHSWGTLVALAAALEKPSALRALVLVGGYFYSTARVDAALLSVPAVPLLGTLLQHTIAPLIGRLVWHRLVGRMFAPRRIPAKFERHFPKWMALRPSQLRAAAEESGMMVPAVVSLQDRYGDISLPTAILAGEEDRIVDPSHQSARLAEDIPEATLRIAPGLGHMLHHFAPEEVAAAIHEVSHRAAFQSGRAIRAVG